MSELRVLKSKITDQNLQAYDFLGHYTLGIKRLYS
jgi:hypothetical protein